MGKRENDIFTDGEDFNLEKVERSGFPYCIDMMIRDESSVVYSSLQYNGMFGGTVMLNDQSWSGEFQVYYTRSMYMNIYLIRVGENGKLILDNRLSYTWLRDFPVKVMITLDSNYYPNQNESLDANAANGVKILFNYRNEVSSFSVEERTKNGELIKSNVYDSAKKNCAVDRKYLLP